MDELLSIDGMKGQNKFIPVCTLSPIFRSAIVTDLPFSSLTSAKDGKQPPPDAVV